MSIPNGQNQPSAAPMDPMAGTSLADLEAIRLLLQGQSVIDWHQLAFQDDDEVRRFLRLNEFDPDDPEDMERLEHLRAEAVEYLTRHFDYRIPEDVRSGVPAQELLLLASRRGRHQTYACVVLKVMHVMHHLDGREFFYRLPVADDEVFGLVESKVVHMVEAMRAAGHPITEFSWSRKERDSMITKLLAKRNSIAAHVYDKLRFRLVTRSQDDLAPLLREMVQRLVPFNYVIPGETVNQVLSLRRLAESSAWLQRLLPELQEDIGNGEAAEPKNEFSGPGYRVINFVADLPIRVAAVLRHVGETRLGPSDAELDPRTVIFVLTEFQLIDAQTARENENGENSHTAYKERQRILVKGRLTRGMKWVKP